MGKVTWGIDSDAIDDAERSQYKPYDGPVPPNGLYAWRVKNLKAGTTSNDNPQLIIGLELVPRRSRPEEKKYKGYYTTEFMVVTEGTASWVAAFCDAIGVTGEDLVNRTKDDGEEDARGNTRIISIGKWRNDGKTLVLGTLVDDNYRDAPRKRVRDFWSVEEGLSNSDADDADDDGEDDAEEERPKKKAAPKKASRRAADEDDSDDGEDDEDSRPKKAAKKAAKKATGKRRAQEDADDEDAEDEDAPF